MASRAVANSMTATLGIDLASQPKNTALCCIAWRPGLARIRVLLRGTSEDGVRVLDDHLLVCAMSRSRRGLPAPSKIAIDAPLGWPVDFVRGVSDLRAWPIEPGGTRRRLERRATDHWVHQRTGKLPLSVTTDRIAYPAMRAAGLLAHYAASTGLPVDRAGVTGPVCEAYPEPAIRRFGLWPDDAGTRQSYKGAAAPLREQILIRLRRAASWLKISPQQRQACIDSDHCLDALICALVARAAQRDLTVAPPAELAQEARLEGWIHLPTADALQRLV